MHFSHHDQNIQALSRALSHVSVSAREVGIYSPHNLCIFSHCGTAKYRDFEQTLCLLKSRFLSFFIVCICVWTLIGASEHEFSRVTEAGVDGGSVLSKTEAGEHGRETHQEC